MAKKKDSENDYRLHRLLSTARYPVSLAAIQEALNCSKRTVTRTIANMRDNLDAPIEHRREHPAGYFYTDRSYELPGVWFSEEEMQALLLVLTLLEAFEPRLLKAAVGPLRRKLSNALRKLGITADTRGRVRLLRATARPPGPCFEKVATALLQRKRMSMRYRARGTGEVSKREVSPQRLTQYRDNWYLDAWCHVQNGLRTFSEDCIDQVVVDDREAMDIPAAKLDRKLGAGYGIFAGEPVAVASLRFTPERARWVGAERWHPDQKSRYEESGHYVLELPYSRPDELINDILRHGPDVEVLAPLDLRKAVADRLRAAAAQYAD